MLFSFFFSSAGREKFGARRVLGSCLDEKYTVVLWCAPVPLPHSLVIVKAKQWDRLWIVHILDSGA